MVKRMQKKAMEKRLWDKLEIQQESRFKGHIEVKKKPVIEVEKNQIEKEMDRIIFENSQTMLFNSFEQEPRVQDLEMNMNMSQKLM